MTDDRQSKNRSKRTIALATAEDRYRVSLQADPTSREVRLHLGRVLAVEGRDADARGTLEPLLTEADERYAYLAHVFLANLAARRHDDDTARREYSAAMSVNPSSDTPYIGLSNLALLADDERGAREYVRRWTTRQSGAPDPWIAYRTGIDQIDPAVERLLERIAR